MDPASFFISLCIMLSALVPVIYFAVPMPHDGLWFWYVLIAAFFGLFLWNFNVWIPIKIISVGMLLICFFNHDIDTCYTQYIVIVICCYFYWLCSRIKDWTFVFLTVRTLVFLNVLLIVMQRFGYDSLLNFGRDKGASFGILGQHMQEASFLTIATAFLFPHNRMFVFLLAPIAWICHSSWTAFNFGVNVFFYFRKRAPVTIAFLSILLFCGLEIKYKKILMNTQYSTGRLEVWKQAEYRAARYPLTGYGPGTFKIIFPAVQEWPGERYKGIPYKTAHNFIVQLLFETGRIFTGFILGVLFWLGAELYRYKLYDCFMGLSLMFVDALMHFPDRMFQTVPMIIAYLAYCNSRIRDQKQLLDETAAAGHTPQSEARQLDCV